MLTELLIKRLKPAEKVISRADGNGLVLEINPSGNKYWFLRCTVGSKRRKFSLGKYPDISLKEAREMCIEKRRQLAAYTGEHTADLRFGELAEAWYDTRITPRSKNYSRTVRLRLNKYILPELRERPVQGITGRDILKICRAIEMEGYTETAHRVLDIIRAVYHYSIAIGAVQADPSVALAESLRPSKRGHYAAITSKAEMAALMRSIKEYPEGVVRNAMLLSAYTFCRPGEIRGAEWSEVDLLRSEWRIPAERMKARRELVVPLSRQAAAVFAAQQEAAAKRERHSRFVFPSERSDARPISADTVRIALRTLGWSAEQMTAHGFRHSASTFLNESGLWSIDAIEAQLAHVPAGVRAIYNQAQYLPERAKMLQWYADFLDNLG